MLVSDIHLQVNNQVLFLGHYKFVIESIFTGAGFTNVRCVPLNDLTIGVLKKPGMVASITVNGHEITSGGRKFMPDATVVISYHSFLAR